MTISEEYLMDILRSCKNIQIKMHGNIAKKKNKIIIDVYSFPILTENEKIELRYKEIKKEHERQIAKEEQQREFKVSLHGNY